MALWLVIYELVRLGIDEESKDASISVIFFLCCPIVVYGVNHVIKQRAQLFKIMHIKDFTKDLDVEMYLHVIIDLIKKRSKRKLNKNENNFLNRTPKTMDGIRRYGKSSCQTMHYSELSVLTALKK